MKRLFSVLISLSVIQASFAQETNPAPSEVSTNAPVTQAPANSTNRPITEGRSRISQSPTNSVATTNKLISSRPVDPLKVLTSRNIFDQSRRPGRSAVNTGPRTLAPRVESFGLVGTMLSTKGETAFFAGSSYQYQKSLKKGESIAGYKVDKITNKAVTLVGTNDPVEMKLGNYLRRENEGAWTLSAAPEPAPISTNSDSSSSTSATTTTSSSAGSAEVSEVMKRLMENREKELSK
ncbi:MAG: hypothetical protein JWM04_1667 [Verrucomicrobiales bacterium]|jgi:hypothetical protein|nr:hypothetical protein [Verrucomicrobiales bacterium]